MSDNAWEKRAFVRVPFHTVVDIVLASGTIRSDEGINISMGGLRISTKDPLPPPDTPCVIRIVLEAPGRHVIIKANARTVYAQPGVLAAEFIDLDLEGYHHLRRLIAANSDDPDRAEREFEEHWGIRKPPP